MNNCDIELQRWKKWLYSISVMCVSLLLIGIWGHFDPEAFLIDDNRTQWFPVIERAYSDFFHTGHMPIYDFFQLKGFSIANPGYYSIMNPLMLVSYLLSHSISSSINTITVYLALLFGMGNTVFFWLCYELKRSIRECAIFTLAYSVISSFFSVCYWYYAFNNQFFIPLLLYVFIKLRGTKSEYFGCGLVLAFEILFGNVQYTCYHYMLYGILCLSFVVFRNYRMIKVLISNGVIGLILSSPFFLLLMRSSESFGSNQFLSSEIPVFELSLGALMPMGIFETFDVLHLHFISSLIGRTDYTWLFNGFFAAFWLVTIIGMIVYFLRKDYRKIDVKGWYKSVCNTPNSQLMVGMVICLLFFISFSSGGIIAILLSKLPVIGKFRFLFKVIFVVEPLLAVMTVLFVPSFPTKLYKAAIAVGSLFIVLGLINNYFVVQVVTGIFRDTEYLTVEEEYSYGQETISRINWDTSLYRYASYSKSVEPFHYWNGFTRNFSTTMGVYSLSAYEIPASTDCLESFSLIYSPLDSYTRRMNIGNNDYVINNADRYPEELEMQLRQNAVRYIFVQRIDYLSEDGTPSYRTPELLEAFNSLPSITVEDVIPADDKFDVIVLGGIDSLCTDGENAIPLLSERMDKLSFQSTGADEYTLSFIYDPALYAYVVNEDGTYSLETKENDAGNTIIISPDGQRGTVYLTYKDPVCTVAFGFEIVLTAALIIFMVRISSIKRGDSN